MNLVISSDEILMQPAGAVCEPAAALSWQERRDWFGGRVQQQPVKGVSAEEIAAHFAAMPSHYWQRVNQEDLIWGLETIHGFLTLVATPNVAPTTPVTGSSASATGAVNSLMTCCAVFVRSVSSCARTVAIAAIAAAGNASAV